MRIYPIQRELNFTAGKTKILSDFDGTFMPEEYNHDSICNDIPPVERQKFSSHFNEFDEFLKEDKNGERQNELTISTGRNLSEFNYYMKKIKEKGLKIPVPDRLITVNGGDEFISSDNKDYFSSSKQNMFDEKDKNQDEQTKLSRFLISYDPKKVMERVMEFLSNLKGSPKIYTPATHQGMFGYKDNMTLQEAVENSGCGTNYVSMRQDGNYQIRLTAPYMSPYVDTMKAIPDVLEDEGYKIYTQITENDFETCVNSALEGEEQKWVLGTSIGMKPMTRGKVRVLDKFHHAKIMVDEITKNNSDDLVIVAGDGRNDLPMLNLSNYIDNMTAYSDFSKPEFQDEIKKLPVRAIYVKNSRELDSRVSEYEKYFNYDGVQRFIIVDKDDPMRPHTLLEAIRKAKENYGQQNPNYKEP